MIRIMPSEHQNPHTSEVAITKRRSFNNQKLALPPLKWKGKETMADGQLSNAKRRVTPNHDASDTRKHAPVQEPQEIKSILRSSIASCIANSRSYANLKERKRVTFIDDAMNMPIAEFSDQVGLVRSKKRVCHCVIF
jgi:hypothetical protein